MAGPLDGFVAKTAELTAQVEILITRVKGLAIVGDTYSVAAAKEAAEAAALAAQNSAQSILALDIQTATDAAAAAEAASIVTTKAGEVSTKHGEVISFATGLPATVQQIIVKAQEAAASAEAALARLQSTVAAQEAVIAAKDVVEADLELVQNGVAAAEEVRDQIADLNANMTAAIAAAGDLSALSALVGTSAFSSTFKFADLSPGASATLDADAASIIRVNLTHANTALSISAPTGSITKARQITVILRQGTGSNKVTWSSSVRWANGMAPVLSFSNGDEDVITLLKCGNDSKFYGFFSGDAFSA